VVPSNALGIVNAVTGNTDAQRNVAMAVYQTEYTRYALGLRDKPPTVAEAREAAGGLTGIYGKQRWSSFLGLSTQFKSPLQPYIDYYHQLQQKDPDTALARFYAEMGDEYRMMTASVSRNVAGLPASDNNYKQLKRFRDLVGKYPDLAPLIVGAEGAGEFSSAVYQAQLNEALQPGSDKHFREVMTLPESVEDAEKRLVWVKYGKLMDSIHADMAQRGLTSLNQKGAADLKRTRQKFIADHMVWTDPNGVRAVNPWYKDFSTTDESVMTQRLTGMLQLVMDPRVGQRDEMRMLRDYLTSRKDVRETMARRGYATLDSQKAAGLRNRWNRYVFGLKDSSPAFASLYDRWLTGDANLTAPMEIGEGVLV